MFADDLAKLLLTVWIRNVFWMYVIASPERGKSNKKHAPRMFKNLKQTIVEMTSSWQTKLIGWWIYHFIFWLWKALSCLRNSKFHCLLFFKEFMINLVPFQVIKYNMAFSFNILIIGCIRTWKKWIKKRLSCLFRTHNTLYVNI